jgi:alpha-D-xyloside xylohydrolase
MENVIRVQVVHHKGKATRKPEFTLHTQSNAQVSISNDEDSAMLNSGNLSVRVNKGNDWLVEYLDGDKVLTSSGWRAMGFVDTPDGRYIHEQLNLGIGECVYGLGERFTAFVKNGQVVEMWNEDGGTSSEQAYKNIPFYLTNHGYGVFVNHLKECHLKWHRKK